MRCMFFAFFSSRIARAHASTVRHGFHQATVLSYCDIYCHTCYSSRWAEFFLKVNDHYIWVVFFGVLPKSGQTDAVARRGTVRLVRKGLTSSSYSSGRVQIYLTSWGHICDDLDFGLTEANVICHQQGYTGAASYSRASSDLSVWAVYTVQVLYC